MKKEKVLTVSRLLSSSDVNELLDEFEEVRSSVDEVVIIHTKKGKVFYSATPIQESRLVYLLEVTKLSVLDGD